MDALGRRPLGINVAPAGAAATPLRHYVLGEASVDRAATAGGRPPRWAGSSATALDAGAFGLSTTILQNHVGDRGRPLAYRLASAGRAARALCTEPCDAAGPRDVIEAAITCAPRYRVTDGEYDERWRSCVEESRRPVTYLAVFARPGRLRRASHEVVQRNERRCCPGATAPVPQVSTAARSASSSRARKNPFHLRPPWPRGAGAFNRTEADSARATRARASAPSGRRSGAARRIFRRPVAPHHRARRGRRGDALAALGRRNPRPESREARGHGTPPTPSLDLALADGLETLCSTSGDESETRRARAAAGAPTRASSWDGLSDGGAHVDQLCDAGYATYLLGKWVRQAAGAHASWQGVAAAHLRVVGDLLPAFPIGMARIAPGRVADPGPLRPGHRETTMPAGAASTTSREAASDPWSPGPGASMPLSSSGQVLYPGRPAIPAPGPVPCFLRLVSG